MATAEFPSSSDKVIWDIWMTQHQLPVLTVSLDLGVFKELAAVPGLTCAELAARLLVGERGVEALLAMLASVGLLNQHEARFSLTDAAQTYLLPASPYYWGAMLLGDHNSAAHDRLKTIVTTDNPDGASAEWEAGELTPERARHLTAEMHAHSMQAALVASKALAPVFTGEGAATRLLDVAGGSGVFATAFAQRYGGLSCTIMELPPVCKLVTEEYIPAGLASRVDTTSVDMFREAFPTGYDAHFFSNVWHDWTKAQNLDFARKSFAALPSGGRILLHEQLMADGKDGPVTTAGFSIHMLLHTKGRQYSLPDLRALLEEAGFGGVTAIPSHAYYSVVVGVKP